MVPRILAVFALVAALGAVAAPSEAASTCGGRKVTIQGTDRSERINGTRRADVIDARGGDDVVNGLGGNDVICGGEGADDLRGQGGHDRLYGGLDAWRSERIYTDTCAMDPPYYCTLDWLVGDVLRGGSGNDRLVPGWDTRDGHEEHGPTTTQFPQWRSTYPSYPTNTFDELRWDTSPRGVRVNLTQRRATGEGTDTIVASGRLRVLTSPYADIVVGTTGPDFIRAGAGSDSVFARDGDDYVELDAYDSTWRDADLARGGPGADYLRAGTGPDVLLGEEGEDRLLDRGIPGADRLYGGADDDVLADVVVPLPGQVADGGEQPGDTFWPYLRVGGSATWDMGSGAMSFSVPSSTAVLAPGFHDFQYVESSSSSWVVTGTEQADTVRAPGRFDGRGGDDWYGGGSGPDTFDGGAGDDRYGADGGGTNTCTSVEVDPQSFCASNTP